MSSAVQTSEREQNWLSTILSALFVAILAGLIVWWLTKPPNPTANVVYTVTKTGSFLSSPTGRHFFNVLIRNQSENFASGVTFIAQTPNNAEIVDFVATTSATRPEITLSRVRKNLLNLQIPRLRSGEVVSLSVAVNSIDEINLSVSATIDSGSIKEIKDSDRDKFQKDPTSLFKFLFVFALFSILIVILTQRLVMLIFGTSKTFDDINNISFLLIHSGQLDEAKDILKIAISGQTPSALALSNYAVILALGGQFIAAKRISTGILKWIPAKSYDRKTIDFNARLIGVISGSSGITNFINFANKDKLLAKYIRHSDLIQDLIIQSGLNNSSAQI